MQHTDLLTQGMAGTEDFVTQQRWLEGEPAATFPAEGWAKQPCACPQGLSWSESGRHISSPFPQFLYVTVGRGKSQRGNHKWSRLLSLSKQQNGLQVQPVCFPKNPGHCCLSLSWGNVPSCMFARTHHLPRPCLPRSFHLLLEWRLTFFASLLSLLIKPM